MTLYKWWPGGHATFNVLTPAQWETVKNAVDELAPYLKWSTRAEIAKKLRQREREGKKVDSDLRRASGDDPSILATLVEGIDFKKITPEELPDLAKHLANFAEVLVGADRRMRQAIEEIVKKLPKQGRKATESLADLLEQLTLRQITAVTSEVQRRLDLLALFKKRMLDDRTYEIRGEGSIHRLLEQAMWIVDERWWLLHSNEPLRTIIGRSLVKKEKNAAKRPDFVCGTVDGKLVIVEIKRPNHVLTVNDLNQLEQYVTLGEKFSQDFSSLEAAILVGRRASNDLTRTLKHRSGRFRVRTYDDLVHDTERRYRAYLDAMHAE